MDNNIKTNGTAIQQQSSAEGTNEYDALAPVAIALLKQIGATNPSFVSAQKGRITLHVGNVSEDFKKNLSDICEDPQDKKLALYRKPLKNGYILIMNNFHTY